VLSYIVRKNENIQVNKEDALVKWNKDSLKEISEVAGYFQRLPL
jgi:hypothetical protein